MRKNEYKQEDVTGFAAVPVLIAVGLVAYFKKKCHICNSKLTLNKKCIVCDEETCGGCSREVKPINYKDWKISSGGRCCDNDWKEFNASVNKQESYIDAAEEVKTVSINYKGRIPDPVFNKTIETDEFKEKTDAERHLRIIAASQGATVITKIEFERATGSEGNYQFTVWRASGLI